MSRYFESIRIFNGKAQNLEWHQERVNETFIDKFPNSEPLVLEQWVPSYLPEDLHKMRFIYSDLEFRIELHPYEIPVINSLKLVDATGIDYNYKSENRSQLDDLYNSIDKADDMIMVRNGYITDSWYANLLFEQDGIWYTPRMPLLNGTKRRKLLSDGKILEKDIRPEDLNTYRSITLINAMLDPGDVTVSTDSIKA